MSSFKSNWNSWKIHEDIILVDNWYVIDEGVGCEVCHS